MRSNINKFIVLAGVFVLAVLWSCTDEPDIPEPTGTDYSKGVFVVNEGNFGSGSGTLTFIKRDGSGLEQKVYQNANTLIKLGNVVQSMNVIGDSVFIVVNNSNRIVVCHKYSMFEAASIEDIEQPRFLVELPGDRFAVSCWDHTVKLFNKSSLTQVEEIETDTGPEKMLLDGNRLWILNSGGLSVDSTITIANIQNGNKQTLQVYPRPTGIQQDVNGKIWVMCSGRKDYHPGGFSPSHLLCIDPETMNILTDVLIQHNEHDAIGLEINHSGNTLYYLFKGDIYQFEIDAIQPNDQPLVDYPGTIYSLGYDPVENTLYGADALDYTQNGFVSKYDAASGALLLEFSAGIIPGAFYFAD